MAFIDSRFLILEKNPQFIGNQELIAALS